MCFSLVELLKIVGLEVNALPSIFLDTPVFPAEKNVVVWRKVFPEHEKHFGIVSRAFKKPVAGPILDDDFAVHPYPLKLKSPPATCRRAYLIDQDAYTENLPIFCSGFLGQGEGFIFGAWDAF